MLTIAYLLVETWKVFWRPRATVARKSSFRTTLHRTERPALQQQRQAKQQQADPLQTASQPTTGSDLQPRHESPKTAESPRPLFEQPPAKTDSSCASEERKVIGRGIPVASKHIVPSVSKPIQSAIQPQESSTNKASPTTKSNLQPSQTQPSHQQPQPSHIPTPVHKSVKTLVLEPSISGNRMDENWAKTHIEKFSFSFDEADKDKSGSLSFTELYNVLLQEGFKGSQTEAQFIFGQIDKDGSQTISRDEFNACMRKVPRMFIREYVYRKAFKQMDKDNSGSLTKTELMDATKNEGGIEIGDKVISDLLVYISKEEDDEKVDYEEFLRVLGIEATASVMYKVFKAMDKDGSGALTRNEMMDAVSNDFELKLSANFISSLLIDLVKDDDQKMNYDEFIQSWLKQKDQTKK